MHTCSLCLSPTEFFVTWKTRTYFRCFTCALIQLSVSDHPSNLEEKSEYMMHKNDSEDEGYRHFLSRVTKPVLNWLDQTHSFSAELLDFGCGPGPTISVVLAEEGWTMDNYDPMFFPNHSLLDEVYDLVVCTEVVEHFFSPRVTWGVLIGLLKEKGRLVVMTHVSDTKSDPTDFVHWHYIRERSHVSLYHTDTMRWLAQEYGLSLIVIDRNVFCFESL